TYRVSATVTTNTRTNTANAFGASASSTPTVVATPLPPLNPAKQVQMCPATAASPTATVHVAGPPGNDRASGSFGTSHTGSAPFETSSSSVRIPRPGPSTR